MKNTKPLSTILFGLFALFIQTSLAQVFPSGLNLQNDKTNTQEIFQDALGRTTPRGTVKGFISAVAKEDYEMAAQYFELNFLRKNQKKLKGIELAQSLQKILDQIGQFVPTDLLSDASIGNINDRLDKNFEKVGSYQYKDKNHDLILSRNNEGQDKFIWLFSQATLKNLPKKQKISEINESIINQALPKYMQEKKWYGAPAGHWIGLIVLAGVSFLLSSLLVFTLIWFFKFLCEKRKLTRPVKIAKAFSLPIQLYFSVLFFVMMAQKSGISIIIRQSFSKITVVVSWVAILLLVWRLIDVFSKFGENKSIAKGNFGALSAILFFRRSMKFLLIALGAISVLGSIGVDVTTGIAALGIGGIALALGAQKSVENLVGSITVIFDQPARVGDFCSVSGIKGTVEQIGMRSTRLRTLERTIVTIPNGEFASAKIENYTRRDCFLFNPTLGLRYETTMKQLKSLQQSFKDVLISQEEVIPQTIRVRFLEFGADTLNIEIFSHIQTDNYNSFLEIQEILNFTIMDIVEKSGTDFAFPSQTIYLAKNN